MKFSISRIILIFALTTVISNYAHGQCFSPDACQNSFCKTAEIVNCPGSGFFCQACFSPTAPCSRITTAIPIMGSCTACGGVCSVAPASAPGDNLFSAENVSRNASNPEEITFSLVFSRNLRELESVLDHPHKLLALLMLEGSSGTPPIGRSSFFQFGVSAVESRNNLTQRIQSGLPLSELHSSGQLNSELPIAIDYMVDLAAYELDASTLELVIEAWPAAEYAKTEPETRLTVKVSNRGGQAPHEYSISSVNLERILFNEREGKLQ